MNTTEVEKVVRTLGGLFPNQITVEQAKYLRAQLAGFALAAAEKAVRDHRASHEFISYPQLLEGCRSADRAESEVKDNAAREGTWFDVRRRLQPQLKDAGDVEVCLRVHRAWWVACSQTDSYKSQFLTSCKSHLLAAGVELGQVQPWAETILWDVPSFRQALDDALAHYSGRSNAA